MDSRLDDRGPFETVTGLLDPVLTALGFAPGQGAASEARGQVIYCGVHPQRDGACADVVLTLERRDGEWRITDVSYDGFVWGEAHQLRLPSGGSLGQQVEQLVDTVAQDLGR